MTAQRRMRLTPLTKIVAELYSARFGLMHAAKGLTAKQRIEYRKVNRLTRQLLEAELYFRELEKTA